MQRFIIGSFLAMLSAAGASDAGAQGFRWPEDPENLKVLPDSIRGDKLGDVMKGFSFALGVRCSHCHVGEEGKPLTEFDFPADDKETKRIARLMLEMVRHINESHLAPVDTLRATPQTRVEVTCTTCHHGVDRPRLIQDVIGEELDAEGVEAAEAMYQELREEYYGGFSYDFQTGPLVVLAEDLAARGKVDEAVAMAELELQFYPESYSTYFALARIQARAERREEAIANMETAVQYAPDNVRPFLQRQLDAFKSK